MERPTTGRRHIRAGSITVAELIKNRPTPVRMPSRDEAATEEMPTGLPASMSAETTEPMPPVTDVSAIPAPLRAQPSTHHRRPPARSGQLAKIAGLGVATAVLCAAVAAASIITTQRQTDQDAVSRPVTELTNEQALLPNLFTLSASDTPRMTTELPAPNTGSAAGTLDSPGPARRAAEAKKLAGNTQAAPLEAPAPTDADLVRQYYKLLAEQPTKALSLLDGVLRQSDLSHFVSSWSQVHGIQVVEVQKRGANELLAVVDMVLPQGGKARVQQLLKVSESTPQRITGAEIVSAQRS